MGEKIGLGICLVLASPFIGLCFFLMMLSLPLIVGINAILCSIICWALLIAIVLLTLFLDINYN